MKCPTCGYIGFETTDRCRNCGYEFALATPSPAAPDLAIKSSDPGGPLRELDMRPADARPAASAVARSDNTTDLDRVLQNLDRVLGGPEPAAPDLPLFDDRDDGDLAPVVVPGVAPRRPLSVRRTTPDPAKFKARVPRPPADAAPRSLELPLPDRAEPDHPSVHSVATAAEAPGEGAPPLRRFGAAALDLAIIGAIDVVVFSFTLRLCGLTTSELSILPALPLLAFFALINGGYFAMFTAAGGQTIGKMAFGLRVVGHADLPVSAGLSVLRALGCLASVISFGVGFVPAILNDGGRALEDRLADTRVIRVPAS
jgi:resuscitation-promoting factor RpfA